ncbi:MAG: hypothetical protein R2932_06835 [Caldilineaceae bacterium]
MLVLGLAFVMGGWRFGELRFDQGSTRIIVTLTVLAVSALIVPTLVAELHTPAGGHEEALSMLSAVILLTIFICSIFFANQSSSATPPAKSNTKASPGRSG